MGKRDKLGVLQTLERIRKEERKVQLFMRAMTGGVLSERDLLLGYTVGEFYNEMSLYIEEGEIRKKELDAVRNSAGKKT